MAQRRTALLQWVWTAWFGVHRQARQAVCVERLAVEAHERIEAVEAEGREAAGEAKAAYDRKAREAERFRERCDVMQVELALAKEEASGARHRLMLAEAEASEAAWLDEREVLLSELACLREASRRVPVM